MHDIPVYLPTASPQVPHRLVVIYPIAGVAVVVLCGPSPAMKDIEEFFAAHWTPALTTLRTWIEWMPKGFPANITVDPAVASVVVLHRVSRRCITWTRSTEGKADESANLRRDAIASYLVAMSAFFPEMGSDNDPFSSNWDGHHFPVELYSVVKGWKVYSLRQTQATIICLFEDHVPVYAMSSICDSIGSGLLHTKMFI
eukprot:Opistho-1_new@21175